MGYRLFDKYSLLHFAVGIILYFFNFSLLDVFILHTIFEIVENTQFGMHIINTYISFWPGGKESADAFINSVGDTISVIFGWYIAKSVTYNKTNSHKRVS